MELKSIWTWLKRFLRKKGRGPAGRNIAWPKPEEIASLPEFEGLPQNQIVVISSSEGARRAYGEILQEEVVGFDTESKPTFVKGEISKGPHIVQFATINRAFIFMLHEAECRKMSAKLIESSTLKKVGFGLGDDLKRIRIKLKASPKAILDLETLFSAKGYGKGVGVKVAVAVVFKRRFRKSKKASTSNWAASHLTDHQILYAANDAFAAIKVFHALSPKKISR